MEPLRTRVYNNKEQVFCPWRRRWVRLTPEEWVRQQVLRQLVEDYSFPFSRIAVEHAIRVGEAARRCDAVVFDSTLTPLCIIEFKAESVPLTQRVFDQVAVYNRRLRVPLGIVSNGPRTIAYRITSAGYSFLPAIPSYPDLSSPSYPDLSSPSYPDLSPQPTRDAADSPADSPVIRP